jgi:kynureninase
MLEAPQAAVHAKSAALTRLFRLLVEQECAPWGFRLASPEDPRQLGSQICFAHTQGYAIIQVGLLF